MDNILYKSKAGMLQQGMGMGNKIWRKFKSMGTPYLKAELVDNGKFNKKRKLQPLFNVYDWLNLVIDDYSHQLTSWFNSWKRVGLDSRFASDQRNNVDPFIDYINSGNSGNRFAARPLVFRDMVNNKVLGNQFNLSFFELRNIDGPNTVNRAYLRHGPGSYMVINFENTSDFTNTDVSREIYPVQYNSDDRPSTPRSDSHFIFRLKDQILSARFCQDSNPTSAFKDLLYIKADLPEDIDDSFNNQMWLPLTMSSENMHTALQSTLIRRTSSLWSVCVFNSSITKFLGDVHSESGELNVKNDIYSYKITSDETKRGKGEIYADMDDVCYCPLTGYPLKCVVDYRPEVTTETGCKTAQW